MPTYNEILKKSLRQYESEEIIDLIFFRPLASIIVKSIYNTRINPNQITLSAVIFCMISASLYSCPMRFTQLLAALLYLFYCILDCVDGQLARLKKSGTKSGHIIDGMADWVSNFFLYIGLAIGLLLSGEYYPLPFFSNNKISGFILAILSALTVGFHSMIFDYHKANFIYSSKGILNWHETEINRYKNYYVNKKKLHLKYIKHLMISLYVLYCKILILLSVKLFKAERISAKSSLKRFSKTYYQENLKIIRLWGLIGSSTHIFTLAFFTIIRELKIYFFVTVFISNIYFLILLVYQVKINRSLRNKSREIK
jgi:phosphatidylglycerophosphate synthase